MESMKQVVAEKKQKIVDDYGPVFCEYVGKDRLCQMEEFKAEQLHLVEPGKYPHGIVRPSYLQGRAVVRSEDGWRRPLIAMRVELLNEAKVRIAEVVEVIFKRYSVRDEDGTSGDSAKGKLHENNWVSAEQNITEDGREFSTALYGTAGMRDYNMEDVKRLLDGETIVPRYTLCNSNVGKVAFIRLAGSV
jgi:hypothetical protein